MSDDLKLSHQVNFKGKAKRIRWKGRVVESAEHFRDYMRSEVRPRVSDLESSFASDMQGLATTGMETRFVERLLEAVPTPSGWEIGEALAECTLRDTGRVHWPWNTVRDRRTPRASLPGADLVGFYSDDLSTWLLVGQVKTSSQQRTPPSVMTGSKGMKSQIRTCASNLEGKQAILKWLHARCKSPELRRLYTAAVQRFLASGGADILLVGVLIRDTLPNESDLRATGRALSQKLSKPTRVRLLAWYLPIPISQWPALVEETS